MYADIYRELYEILNDEESNVFGEALGYLLGLPRFRRTCFYFHTFTRKDGCDYRVAFLTLKFLRILFWRCRMARLRQEVRWLFSL